MENWVTLPVQRPGSSAVPPSLRPLMPDSDEGGQLNPDDDWQVSERSYDGAEAVLDARSVKFADAPTCDLRAAPAQLPTASAEEVERLSATQISGEVDTASLVAVMAGIQNVPRRYRVPSRPPRSRASGGTSGSGSQRHRSKTGKGDEISEDDEDLYEVAIGLMNQDLASHISLHAGNADQ